jgi:hypothetical protein
MKDSKFIELLNLYVDHQIAPADAALLEAEIQRSTQRRRVYRQYCQMQKACVSLTETFLTQVPAGGKVVEFPAGQRRFSAVTYMMGIAAAAACIALVVVNSHTFERPVSSPSALAARPDVAVQIKAAANSVESPLSSISRVALKPAFVLQTPQNTISRASLVSSSQVPFEWMNRVQLQRLPTEELWFKPSAAFQPEDLTFRSRRAFDGQTEMMSFRFQK